MAVLLPAADSDRKVFDFKITNSFPLIAVSDPLLLGSSFSGPFETLSGFQHFSVPSDLRIHLTNKNGGHRFLRTGLVDRGTGMVLAQDVRLFCWVSRPVENYRAMTGKWFQAALHSPIPDERYDPGRTRMCIEFFAHGLAGTAAVRSSPLPHTDCRAARDRTDEWIGPHFYEGLIRARSPATPIYLASLRMSFLDLPVVSNDSELLIVPNMNH